MGHYFEEVSLLITHYNRSSSLERLLAAFKKLDCGFQEVIVSDDGSKIEHLNALKRLQNDYGFTLITAPENKGLGNNINKGQDAVVAPYTLYVQEDFMPSHLFPEKLERAFEFMQARADLDIVRFYAYLKYPFLKPVGHGFSEMIFSAWPWYWGYRKFNYYSDHPHLRRSSFFSKFGRYYETKNGDVTEYKMMITYLKKKGKSLFYDDYQSLFEHVNSDLEPSMIHRNVLSKTRNPIISLIRHLYRHLKYNFDLHFK